MQKSNQASDEDILLSIVIPTYRRTIKLRELLDVLNDQVNTCTSKSEVIVIDNCSDRSAEEAVLKFGGQIKYFHEPRAGVANARNQGVARAAGRFLIFIDDDQIPQSGWLVAYEKMAFAGSAAVFGPVIPLFEAEPPLEYSTAVIGLFSRNFHLQTGADITAWRAYLGTGNSMFDQKKCFPDAKPFDPRFNNGGEDVWLLRKITQDYGLPLSWCAQAEVQETVPKDRMSGMYVRKRKFRNGQLRCIVEAGGKNWFTVAFWMGAGLAQVLGHGLAAVVASALALNQKELFVAGLYGGLGKVFWWHERDWSKR